MPQYYTYRKQAEAAMGPNQTLDFQAGRGYYLKTSAPAAPPQAAVAQPAAYAQGPQSGPPVAQALASNPFETDPGYLAALAAEQTGSQQVDNALRAAREQAIVRFGDPNWGAGGDVDPLTGAAAQQNTQSGNSSLAQLQRQRDLNQQGIVNSLAAHGIIRSGDLGYKTGQNEQAYGSSLYNSQQDILAALAGQSQNALTQKQGLRADTTKALTSAYQNYIDNPQFWGAADGGNVAAANASAVAAPASPVTTALAQKPVSRLATSKLSGPYAGQIARNQRMG